MATTCITADLKTMLMGMIDKKMSYDVMHQVVDAMFPVCEEGGVAMPSKQAVASTRKMAARWPAAIYVDKTGARTEYPSASALYEKLTGKKPSGSICDDEGKKCTAATLVDSFRFNGYIVQGNGEEAPPTDPEHPEMNLKLHSEWKDHLNAKGLKIIIVHPESPTIQKIQQG
jgi:hypothetical protein